MVKHRPLGIRSSLWLAIGLTAAATMLGAGALHGYQLYRRSEAAEILRIRTLATAYSSQAQTWLGHSRDDIKNGLDAIALHPDVSLLAIVTKPQTFDNKIDHETFKTPEIISLRGDNKLLDRYLKGAYQQGENVERMMLPRPDRPRDAAITLYVAATPICLSGTNRPVAMLVCGARAANRYTLDPTEMGVFFMRLLVAAGAAALLGLWWLKRSVIQPLTQLADSGSVDADTPAAINVSRDDEIGKVARALSEMHMNLDEWRARATLLERNVHQRVASETQRVNTELQQAKKKIWTDPLTQLGNRRLLEDRLEEIFVSQRRDGNDLTMVMIDVDNFKKLNDTQGHAAGDELLRFIGELLKHSLRDEDLAIRYGGDEFILILPSVTMQDAERISERTILLFNQQAKLLALAPRPSLSAGIASLWEHKPKDSQSLMRMADEALYEAKRAGKSCVRKAKRARVASA